MILILRWDFHLSPSTSQPNNSSVYWSHFYFRYSYSPPCLVYSAQLERVQCTLVTGDWRCSFLLCIIQSLHSMHSERNPHLTIPTGNYLCPRSILSFFIVIPPCLDYCVQLEKVQCTLITGDWRMLVAPLYYPHTALLTVTGNRKCQLLLFSSSLLQPL